MIRCTEASLHALTRNLSELILLLTAENIVHYVAPSISTVLGHDGLSWKGQRFSAIVHADDRAKAEQFLRALATETGNQTQPTSLSTELRLHHQQGRWHRFTVTAQNLLTQPEVQGIILTCIDITHQKEREQHIRLLESVVVHANDVVIITEAEPIDQPGPRIVYVNEAFTRETGYTLQEAIGQTPRILQGANSSRATLDQIRAALAQWQPVQVDILNYRKDGSEFWAELSIVPIADETGWFTHWIAIQRNITERKQVEQDTQKALAREKELRELKSRFVSMMSHEFRTPLSTILASSDLLKSFGHRLSEAQKQERLHKIRAEVQHMTQLLDEILLVGKAEAGRMEFHPVVLDVKQLCSDILEETQLWITAQHPLLFSCQEQDIQSIVDEKLVRHMLTNLLSNAIKYSPQGGAIELRLYCTPQTLCFQVQDHGIGIPESDHNQLFEPFHRASNVGNISGTGLGMAIIKHAVDLHRGTIQMQSVVGVGSIFTIQLPYVKQQG